MQNVSVDVEMSVIGSLMMFTELSSKIQLLQETDFTSEALKNIYSLAKKQYQDTNKIDFILLLSECDELQKSIVIKSMEIVISINEFDDHVKRLKELSQKRRLTERVNNLIFYNNLDVNQLEQIIDDEKNNNSYSNCLEKSNKSIDNFISGLNIKKPSILTGFSTLDKITSGIRKGTMFIIGARPSVGKTTFAMNIVSNQFKQNQKTIVFSLEMSDEMIYEKIASANLNIKSYSFTNRTLTDVEVEKITKHMEKIKQDKNLIVIDDVYTVEAISNTIAQNKPDLVVIDYVQVITTVSKYGNLREQMEYITAELKKTAKKNNCVLILLSQLTRSGRETPTMSELKECGGLEANGDYIALLDRPYVNNKRDDDKKPETTSLLLDKNKFGATGSIDMWFELKYQKFYELHTYHIEQERSKGIPFDITEFEDIEL